MKRKQQIRAKFRSDVFTRDKNTCQVCQKTQPQDELDAHHITDRNDMPNGGYVASNGITVCEENCHMRVEKFHISGGQEWEEGLHPDDLYKMIGSSKEQAIRDSERL